MTKKYTQIILVLALIFTPCVLGAGVKIDPYISSQSIQNNKSPFKAFSIGTEKKSPIEIFVQTTNVEKTKGRLAALGAVIKATVGDIIIAAIDTAKIEELSKCTEVIFVEAGKPLGLKNDVAIPEINVTEAHAGSGLSSALTGKGIIVGLIDTGIDLSHPDFQDENGKSRVLAVWNQNDSTGPAPKEIENSYGTECDVATIADGKCSVSDNQGHGTHVAGILAARNEKFGGVAPDANIIAVVYNSSVDFSSGVADAIFSTKICEAANYVFTKAASQGKPAIVNLSLGTHIGPHDGTSLFEKCLSNLVKGQPGRAIVAAAGNEYSSDLIYTGIHAGYVVDGVAATNFAIQRISPDRIYYIDIWAAAGSEIGAGLAVHRKEPAGAPLFFTEIIPAGSSKKGALAVGADGNASITYNINAEETKSALNGKQHIGITIVLDSSIADAPTNTFDLVLSGKGQIDAWLYPDKPLGGISFTSVSGSRGSDWAYTPGDSLKTIAVPATSPDVIAVSAYTTRSEWQNGTGCCKVGFKLGDLITFSSSGPGVDPTVSGNKPDIAAPGGMIAASRSSAFTPTDSRVITEDGKHVLQAGTSMAAPFVSGTIALMFEANPNFTSEDVKRYLMEGAYSDDFAKDLPGLRWGSGKLDSLKAIQLAIKGGASGKFTGASQNSATAAQDSTGSGCSLIAASVVAEAAFSAWFLMAVFFAAAVFMRGFCRKGTSKNCPDARRPANEIPSRTLDVREDCEFAGNNADGRFLEVPINKNLLI